LWPHSLTKSKETRLHTVSTHQHTVTAMICSLVQVRLANSAVVKYHQMKSK